MVAVCNDLRIGGTLAASGLSGGLSINNTRLAVADWSGIFGHVGLNYQIARVVGQPGGFVAGDGLPRNRQLTLNMLITRWNEVSRGALTESSPGDQLWRNTDLFLTYLTQRAGFYLEVDDPDGTKRFIHCYALDPAPLLQREWRRIAVPLISPWPYWRLGGTESSQVVSGAGTITNAGGVEVYDPKMVWAADGTFTNSTTGQVLTVAGSSSAVTVQRGTDGAWQVLQSGVDASNLLTSNDRELMRLDPGSNSVTRTGGNVTVTWRTQYD